MRLFPQAGRTPLCSPEQKVSEPPRRTGKPTLRILQRNTDGLSTKAQELRDRLTAESIDVCLIQETKLVERDAFPPFQGYNSIRFDRLSTHRGGGLLTLVKKVIVFQRAAEDYSPPLERLTIQIQLSRRNFATQEDRKATGSHRILQACQSDLLRCQNLGAHDP